MSRTNIKKINLTKEQEKLATEEILNFFKKERDESLGNMEAMAILSFFIEKIAPGVYNQAVTDTQKYMSQRIGDLYELMV